MARVNFPEPILDWFELFKKVKAKHVADGAGSPLIPYIAEQSISFTMDQTEVDGAKTAHTTFLQKEKEFEKQSEKRDSLLKKVFGDHKAAVQFLKKFYRTNLERLGDWGVTVDDRGRIHYAADFLGKHDEVIDLIDKHDTYAPGSSPLDPFFTENEIDPAVNRANIDNAKTAHLAFQQAEADSETNRELRDTKMDPVKEHLRGIAAFLLGLYAAKPHKAGDWGYVIDAAPKGSKEKTVKLNEGEIKTIYKIVGDSVIKNITTNQLIIYGGKVNLDDDPANLPTPVILNPGEVTLARRGFGTITIKNNNLTAKGSVLLTVLK